MNIHESQDIRERGAIALARLYHFHPLHRRLDSSRVITAENSSQHKASDRTETANLWVPNASR